MAATSEKPFGGLSPSELELTTSELANRIVDKVRDQHRVVGLIALGRAQAQLLAMHYPPERFEHACRSMAQFVQMRLNSDLELARAQQECDLARQAGHLN